MKGKNYDYKEAYNKGLTAKARLHYLENARNDQDNSPVTICVHQLITVTHQLNKLVLPIDPTQPSNSKWVHNQLNQFLNPSSSASCARCIWSTAGSRYIW